MNKNNGFTLIETLFVVGILTMSLLMGTSMIITSLHATEKNKNRFIATYLTQECLELSRNMRDSAWKQNLPWDCGIPNINEKATIEREDIPVVFNFRCLHDTGTSSYATGSGVAIHPSNNPNDFLLWYNDSQFTHDSTITDINRTIFSRKLIAHEKSTDKAKISCETSWTYNNRDEKIEIFEILTNWKK